MLLDFIFRVREGFGIVDQCSQLNIARFRVTISVKDFQVTANCPKGRVFAIDSQEQWNAAISKVITKEQELIDRFSRLKLFIYDHSLPVSKLLSSDSNLIFFCVKICANWSFPKNVMVSVFVI